MSYAKVYVSACPCCGRDLARVQVVTDGHAFICDPESGGCGASTVAAESEAGAAVLWNNGTPAILWAGVGQ